MSPIVIPAHAGIHFAVIASRTKSKIKLDSSFRWNDEREEQRVQ